MLADLNIARKLSLLLILPMATFLFLVTVESVQRVKDINELKFVERALVVSLSAGELIHELQKERGYTAGYLGSKGKKFAIELPEQIKKSDAAFKLFAATRQMRMQTKTAPSSLFFRLLPTGLPPLQIPVRQPGMLRLMPFRPYLPTAAVSMNSSARFPGLTSSATRRSHPYCNWCTARKLPGRNVPRSTRPFLLAHSASSCTATGCTV